MAWLNLFLSLALLFLVYLLIFRYKAPWVPMYKKDLARLDQLIEFKPGQTFYDLGCGNGRIIFYLAKKYPEVKFVGVEISLIFFLICYVRKLMGGYKNVSLKLNDYMRLDFNQADYIYVFANAKPINDIARKIEKEILKPIIILSYCFEIKDWDKFLVEQSKPEAKSNSIYIYQYKKGD